ncbi:PIN-like domain-containing protein [Vibrio apostichopi]|uniref:PIN-like domain-containing protein n=1 Tax=Vibrio apostichopi TaxID=3035453 RepID=UPI002573C774|nr:PIN-like domain-containing protein [Vibrio sp. FE10]
MSNLQFNKREIFPNPSDTFFFKLEPLEEIKDECIFVLDANVLLLPYTTGVKSLNAIKGVYKSLSEADRMFLPAQATREFLDNRATKIADMNYGLSQKMTQSFQYVGSHPLLSELDEYKALEEQEKKVRDAIKSYQGEIKKTLEVIKSWGWNDPVSDMYHEILGGRVLSDEALDIQNIEKDLKRRNELNIPPGYKDKNKDENQAGDLLIWHEILLLATEKKKHLVFISGDEKPDWWHQSGKKPLYPRFELVDEYREKSEGRSFHIISLSSLLELFNAEDEVVKAVKSSEDSVKFKTKQSLHSNSELVERALLIVKSLRAALMENRMASERVSEQRMLKMSTASDEERSEVWNKFHQLDREPTLNLMHYYNSNFKIDAIMTRDEIESRLPNDILDNRDIFSSRMYEHPTNPLGLERVIDDLEYLAKCLPSA